MQAVAALSRGHELFAGAPTRDPLGAPTARPRTTSPSTLPAAVVARSGALSQRVERSDDADRVLRTALTAARADHAHGRAATGTVLDAAPAQHRHISRSRRRARLLALRLRRLHYRHRRPAAGPANQPGGRPAVLAAIRKALDIKGIHDPAARARWERGMDLVARRESNYNAGAVNDWDANAARGTPSKGAWQFIEPTFAAYHQRGTSRDIHNLVAQACAFINYAMGRYGVAADASNLADRIQQADPRRSPKGY
ncbi:transglycosylase SLT domain-containing protein [Mycobacterium avium]|uniref:transglycosylase SLT domain-containing protein n=1 Tax=Mycobacterium avium TaxID=1764 RepID=UPI001CE05B74|nr:transglycosylase [Mycobacterium avium]MCA4734917.1 transglycosylase [Mycobacterium avium subsp. hominissuis]